MKSKDWLVVALAPLFVLLIPLIGIMVSEEWKWTWSDFLVAWVLLAGPTFFYRLLATRKVANFAYRTAAGLGVAAGFLLTWVNLAVQIIGDDNPAFVLYILVIVIGFIGVGLARFQPKGMANAAFATAAATFFVPVIAVILWPTDFSPGVWQVFVLNFGFVALFAASGVLFRRAASQIRFDPN